jgi:hypothetical protein
MRAKRGHFYCGLTSALFLLDFPPPLLQRSGSVIAWFDHEGHLKLFLGRVSVCLLFLTGKFALWPG